MKTLLITEVYAGVCAPFAIGTPQRVQHSKNTLGQEFILIRPGSFLMGVQANDKEAREVEKPQHQVSISKSFYLGNYEVTQAEWQKLTGKSPFDESRSNPFINLNTSDAWTSTTRKGYKKITEE